MESFSDKEAKIIDVLEFIGLHKNERLIYLDLLKNGPSTAVDISKRTKIHRPNTYDAIRKLIEKGFISQIRTFQKNLFKGMDAEKIKDYIEQKRQDVEAIIPQIKEFSKKINFREEVQITKGTFAAREALLGLLEFNQEIKAYGASKEAIEVFGIGFLREFHKKRIKKKIMMSHIYNVDAIDRIKHLNKLKYTQARHLSKAYDTIVATIVCGDTAIIVIFSTPVSIITIRRKEIADTYSKYFDMMWKRAKI